MLDIERYTCEWWLDWLDRVEEEAYREGYREPHYPVPAIYDHEQAREAMVMLLLSKARA